MKHLSLLSVILFFVSLGGMGCAEVNKKGPAEAPQNNEMQTQLSQLRGENAQLDSSNKDLQNLLAARDARILELERQRNAAPKPVAEPKKHEVVPEGWQETSTGAKITITHDILFAPGKASFTPAGAAKMKEVAAAIKSHYPSGMVKVYGYTDNDPIVKSKKLWEDNLDLSANRSMMVTRELIRLGVPADRIETIAMGSTHPVASNADKAGKAKNRRVEIFASK